MMRLPLRASRSPLSAIHLRAGLGLLVLAFLGCRDASEPEALTGHLAIVPVFATNAAAAVVPVAELRVRITRTGETATIVDTTVAVPSGADSVEVDLTVIQVSTAETYEITLELFDSAGARVFQGTALGVTATSATQPPQPTAVVIRYVGVGFDATTVEITTPDLDLLGGETAGWTAVARDGAGAEIPGTPVLWTTSDPAVADFADPGVGTLAAHDARGTVNVVATLLTGPADTASAVVQPAPTTAAAVSGDDQSGTIGTDLSGALILRVTGSDGLGVRGLNVQFAPDGDGAATPATAVTDVNGDASTTWRLGSAEGTQQLTATVEGLATPFTFSATAAPPGMPTLTKAAGDDQTAEVGTPVSILPTVELLDELGNPIADATIAFAVGMGGGAITGASPVTDAAGLASVGSWVLGPAAGANTLTATTIVSVPVTPGLDEAPQAALTDTLSVTFMATAVPPAPGAIEVTTATTGVNVDPDGYSVTVDGGNQSIAVDGMVLFADLAPGDYDVDLGGMASNCLVAMGGPTTVTATVTSNDTTAVAFAVNCDLPAAQLITEAIDSLEAALFKTVDSLNRLDSAGVDAEVNDLDAVTFANAKNLFAQALAQDPTNNTAAFGLAITTIFALEDDPQLRAAAEQWETWAETHDGDDLVGPGAALAAGPLFWKRGTLPFDATARGLRRLGDVQGLRRTLFPAPSSDGSFPPTFEEHQTLLRDVARPQVAAALAAMDMVTDPNFTFTITIEMQGETDPMEADPFELDQTEVLFLRSALEGAVAAIDVASAYLVTPSPWGAAGIQAALAPGSTFGTLAPNGATLLANAHQAIQRGVQRFGEAVDFLEMETDDQSDDIIKLSGEPPPDRCRLQLDNFDLPCDAGPTEIQQARDVLADISSALLGPTQLTTIVGLGDAVHLDADIVVDFSQAFLNPVTDLKTLLPAYTITVDMNGFAEFHWDALAFDEFVLPDPTFNGTFPNIVTTDDLNMVMDVEQLWRDFSHNIDEWVAIAQAPGNGDLFAITTVGNLYEISGDFATETDRPDIPGLVSFGLASVSDLMTNSVTMDIVATTGAGELFARPDDAATSWTSEYQHPFTCCSFRLAESLQIGSIFMLEGTLHEVAGDYSVGADIVNPMTMFPIFAPSSAVDFLANPATSLQIFLAPDGTIFSRPEDLTTEWAASYFLPTTHNFVSLTQAPGDGDLFALTYDGEVHEIASDFSTDVLRPAIASQDLVAIASNSITGDLIALTRDGRVFTRPDDASTPWTLRTTLPRIILP